MVRFIKLLWEFRRTFLKMLLILLLTKQLISLNLSIAFLFFVLSGLFSGTFYESLALLGLLPGIGIHIYRNLSLPLFWLLNGFGQKLYAIVTRKNNR